MSNAHLARAVDATVKEGSARIRVASQRGGPVPTRDDMTGEGVVDLRRDRVWLRHRGVTPGFVAYFRERSAAHRHLQGRASRVFDRLLARFLGSRTRRFREHYYEGVYRYKRKRNGTWSEGAALRQQGRHPEYNHEHQHPLWLLKPLAHLAEVPEAIPDHESVGEVLTTRYDVNLSSAELPAQLWETLAMPDAPDPPKRPRWWKPGPFFRARTRIPASVWLDADGLVRRMSYEVDAYHAWTVDGRLETPASTWWTTELWDFGVAIDRERPPAPRAAPHRA